MIISTLPLPTLDVDVIQAIVHASHGDPFAILGMHHAGEQLVVRVFRPDARAVTVRETSGERREWAAHRVHEEGFFEAVLEGAEQRFRYELIFTTHQGESWTSTLR